MPKPPSVSFANVLTLTGMLLALGASYATLSADNAKQRERVDNLKDETKEIKRDVKETKRDVQSILIKLESIEAMQRAAERRDRATHPIPTR